MKIRINPLLPLMFIAVSLCGNLKVYLVAYSVMALHETAHLLAALAIGLKPESITFSPFGLHLSLRCKIINSVCDEIILYLAGPLVNAFFALMAQILKMPDLYRLNIALFLVNIMPILPLDGGMIIMRLLSFRIGKRPAKRFFNTFSVMMGVTALVIALYGMYIGEINVSLFIIAVLFIGNVLTSKEMYDTDFINSVSVRKKRTNKANVVIIDDKHTRIDALKTLSPLYTTVALVMDNNNKISAVISEKELLETVDGL